jgi:hypothetical protein
MHGDTHICINRRCFEIFYNYINVYIVVFIFRFMEVSMKWCLNMLISCASCFFICFLKTHSLCQSSYLFRARLLITKCKKVETILQHVWVFLLRYVYCKINIVSFNEVWRNDLVMHTMRLNGFILLVLFVTPAGISISIILWTEMFSHIKSN